MKFLPMRLQAILRVLRGPHDGIQIVIVGTAAAQVAGHRETRFVSGRVRVCLQQRHRRHDLARGAEAALRPQFIDHGLLYRVQFARRAFQPLDGGDCPAPDRVSQRRAGIVRDAVDQHRARATLGPITAQFGARISDWKNPFSIPLMEPPIFSTFFRYFHTPSSISSHNSSR